MSKMDFGRRLKQEVEHLSITKLFLIEIKAFYTLQAYLSIVQISTFEVKPKNIAFSALQKNKRPIFFKINWFVSAASQ
jgi:hypothetical protein